MSGMGFRRKVRRNGAGSEHRTDRPGYVPAAFTCEVHGKSAWIERDAAKAAARSMREESRMREYRCEETGHWHIGHMPPSVMRGEETMTEARQRLERERWQR